MCQTLLEELSTQESTFPHLYTTPIEQGHKVAIVFLDTVTNSAQPGEQLF